MTDLSPHFEPERCVRLRGLPFQCTITEIRSFFDPLPVENVRFLTNQAGRLCGEAFTQFATKEQVDEAHTYSVFSVTPRDLANRMPPVMQQSTTVKLRGLPFVVTQEAIKEFFEGLTVASMHLIQREPLPDDADRPRFTGEAFVRFEDAETAVKAHARHMGMVGSRYIEVFQATDRQMDRAIDPSLAPDEFPAPPQHRADESWRPGGFRPRGPTPFNGPPGGGRPPWDCPPMGWHPGQGPPFRPGWRGPPPPPGGGGGWRPPFPPGNWGPPPPWAMPPGGFGPHGGWPSNDQPRPRPPVGHPPLLGDGGGVKRPFDAAPTHSASGTYLPPAQPTVVRLRGLPWKAGREEVERFFAPIIPDDIDMVLNEDGRPSGQCRVTFLTSADARDAMRKNRDYIASASSSTTGPDAKKGRVDDIPIPVEPSGEANSYERHIQNYAAYMQETCDTPDVKPQTSYPQPQAAAYSAQQYGVQYNAAQPTNQQTAAQYSSNQEQSGEWDKYWREYDQYKKKYDDYAKEMSARGQHVPPMQAPAGAPTAPRAPPPPPAGATNGAGYSNNGGGAHGNGHMPPPPAQHNVRY